MYAPSAKKHNVLILSGQLGDGHRQAAQAILEASRLYRPDAEARIVDYMEWTHPHLHTLGTYCYKQWIASFPSMYGYLFQKTRYEGAMSHLFKKIRLFSTARMLKLLEEVKPSVVVSTFPSAAAAMSVLKAQGLTNVPTVTVITDHTDHSYWIHPCTDRYLVGSHRVRLMLEQQHVPSSLIEVTGIPVRTPFTCKPQSRDELRAKHNLRADAPVVMVMGGGYGLIGKQFASLLRSGQLPQELQFVIVCGRNEKLKSQLEEELRHSSRRVVVTGFVDYVHELMAASDLIVTKPGGLTTAEALALELPMLLYKPLPGQEQDNADYLVDAGLALQAGDLHDLQRKLTNLFQNREILTTIRSRAKRLQMKSAGFNAVHAIARTRLTAIPEPDAAMPILAEA